MSLIKIKETPRRRKWGRRLTWAFGGLIALVLVLYFVGTSGMFLQRVILPQISNAIKADVTVGEAALSPFRQVTLRELKVHPRGSEQLMSVKEIRLRYSLLSIIRGQIVVEEVTIESPVITVVENADGTSNLDELLKLGDSDEKPPSDSTSEPPQVNVKLVALNNATVRYVKHHASGGFDVSEMSGLNFTLRDLQNGQTGTMEVAANLAVDQAAQLTTEAGALRAKLGGGFTFDLLGDLKPAAVKGDVTFAVEQATGPLAELAQLTARLDCEMTPTEVKQVALRFTKADVTLGEMRLAGPLDLAKLEGKLKLEVLALDRRVLNLVGAASGIDFGPTTINSTTDLELTKNGNEISVGGRLNVANFQVTRGGQTSPTLDLRWDYALTVDQAAQSAVLKFFNLSGTQNSQLFLQSELPQPLTIAWGEAGGTSSAAAFNLVLTNWNLADWRAFTGETAPAGLVNTRLNLTSQNSGKQLQVALTGGVDNFSLQLGSNQVNQAELRWQIKAQATDMKQYKLEEGRFEILQQGQAALVASATGTFDSEAEASDLQMTAQAILAPLLAFAPQPEVTVSSGTVDIKAHLVGQKNSQRATGNFVLADFTGAAGDLRLNRYGVALDFDAALVGNTFELRKATGEVREGERVGGRLDANGKFDLATTPPSGEMAVKLADFNQDGLRPFLQAALGDKKLVSVALNSTVSVSQSVNGKAALKADAQITNLVVSDPANPALATPLQARVQVNADVANNVAQIGQAQLTLTPTERAKNELNLTGTVNFSKSNAITGSLKLKAESLDVTRYYDLVAGKPASAASGTPPRQPPPTPSGDPESEPPALTLPFENFVCDLDIGRLYLREIDIEKLLATAKLDGAHLVLKPCQLTLNGAPLSAEVDADLGIAGYRYQMNFDAQALPLAPLMDTFAPDLVGQIGGQLSASGAISGAGVTGTSLQTNLTGQFAVLATNLNLSISNVRSPVANTIINIIVVLPELIKNPATLLGRGAADQKSGWADDITAQPIQVVHLQGRAGEGKINLQQAQIRSAAFEVQGAGDIAIAPVLTNSVLNFPLKIALGRRYADKIGLVTADTPTNEVYVALPDFVTVKNTLGDPKTDISQLGILAVIAKTSGGIGKQIGLATGDQGKAIFDAVSGILGGKPAATDTNAAATNGAAQPAKRSGSLLDLLRKPKSE